MTHEIPFGVAEVLAADATWRDGFAWPISSIALFESATNLQSRLNDLIIVSGEPERDVLLLGRSFNKAAALLEAALAINAESALGLKLNGPRDLAVLRGEQPFKAGERSDTVFMVASGKRANLKPLRQVARTASWTSPPNLLRALLKPDGIAVTHNPLLVSDVKRRALLVKYDAVDDLFARCIEKAPRGASIFSERGSFEALIERTVAAIVAEPRLDERTRDIIAPMMRSIVRDDLSRADATLAALDRSNVKLPRMILSGTGGSYAARAIGMTAMRRGGTVRRYDHGGTASLMADTNFLAQQELAVSTEFVMPTKLSADAADPTTRRLAPIRVARICYSTGDPGLDPGPRWRRSTGSNHNRRVLYVGTAYYGFSQTFPPFPPSSVYIDWQHRLLETLQRLPIDLKHKPHPGGLMRGNPTFLGKHGPMLTNRFEDALDQADVLVIDIAASTTFATALCTDCPVVLLDFGCMPFNPVVSGEIFKRCRVLPIDSDDRNRLIIDEAALEEAVCGGPDREDPSFFRDFFLGR